MSKQSNPTHEVTATSAYGKPLYGKLVVITCVARGCKAKRTIKTQDMFQVKRCPEHQKQYANERAKARRAAKREAEAKKKPKVAPAKLKAVKKAPKGSPFERAVAAVDQVAA
jgi:hypothetical protein